MTTNSIPGVPVTRQIVQALEARIMDGSMAPGSRLPSVRDLATQYEISTAVCLSAYRTLEKKGLVERRAGSGTYVAEQRPAVNARTGFFSWSCIFPAVEMEALLKRVAPELAYAVFTAASYGYNPQYLDWIKAKNAGDEANPGLVAVNEGQLPCLAREGQLLPLDDWLAESKVLDMGLFPPEVLRALRWNGKLYALPMVYSPTMLFWNRRIFREEGLDEAVDAWDWNDLHRHVLRLTREKGGRIARYGLAVLLTVNTYAPFIFQNGGELFDHGGNCVVDGDAAFEALSFFSDLYHLPGVCSQFRLGEERGALAELLRTGLAAMLLGDGVDYCMVRERMAEGDWGMARMPACPTPRGAGRRNTSLSVWGVGLTRGERAPERFALLERLFAAEPYRDFCRSVHGLPAYDPVGAGVPAALLEVLPDARVSLQSVSPEAVNALGKTIDLVLSHKLLLTRSRCREFRDEINAGL